MKILVSGTWHPPTANDYGKPVAVYNKGPLADMIGHIPKLKEKVFLSEDIKELIKYLEDKA